MVIVAYAELTSLLNRDTHVHIIIQEALAESISMPFLEDRGPRVIE
jgi:hypothetical protein